MITFLAVSVANGLPYFKWYPKDAETDENFRRMTDQEVGFYLRCLDHCWINGSLPSDFTEMGEALGRPAEYCERLWPRMSKCFRLKEGRLTNPRQEVERACAKDLSTKNKKAAEHRWSMESYTSDANAIPLRTDDAMLRAYDYESVSESVVSSSSNKTTTPEVYLGKSAVGEVFEELKTVYRQAGKPISKKHEHLAIQLLMGIPEDRLPRVPNYVKWALVSGTWSDAAHTKGLLNVLRDGDWDVEIVARSLPQVIDKTRQVSKAEMGQDEAERRFLEKRRGHEANC